MKQEVYADLYFLVNASMDLLCLMISAALLHRKVVRWRALVGAALGGAYAVAILLIGLDGIAGVAADIAAAFVICAAAFAEKKVGFGALLQVTAVDALTSALLGGIMTAMFSWHNKLALPLESLQGDGLSVWMFAVLAAVAGILTVRGGKFFGRSGKTRSVTLEAELFGKRVTMRAMVDSGNLLRDPISGKSVIVAEKELFRGILPDAFFRDGGRGWIPDHATAVKVRLIPTQTATGAGMLTAFLPDSLTIVEGSSRIPSDFLIAAADLGPHAQGFDALVPAD